MGGRLKGRLLVVWYLNWTGYAGDGDGGLERLCESVGEFVDGLRAVDCHG